MQRQISHLQRQISHLQRYVKEGRGVEGGGCRLGDVVQSSAPARLPAHLLFNWRAVVVKHD